MTAVIHLIPGDRINGATFISQRTHPIYPREQLLVWVDDDGTVRLEAAPPGRDIGPVELATAADRDRRLREALPEHAAAAANGGRR